MRRASQHELDALAARVNTIDEHGTRGVGVIQAQLTELVKDVGKLEGRLDAHSVQHQQEARERVTGRRWLIGTGIAVMGSMAAVLAVLATLAGHLA